MDTTEYIEKIYLIYHIENATLKKIDKELYKCCYNEIDKNIETCLDKIRNNYFKKIVTHSEWAIATKSYWDNKIYNFVIIEEDDVYLNTVVKEVIIKKLWVK